MQSMLVATESQSQFVLFKKVLDTQFSMTRVSSLARVEEALAQQHYDFLMLDLGIPGLPKDPNFRELFQLIWRYNPQAYIVVLASRDKLYQTVGAVKAGADDYLVMPLTIEEIQATMARILSLRQSSSELAYLRDQFWQKDVLSIVQTNSTAMQSVFDTVRSVAETRSTVLLSGETGVGKSLIARLIHRHSKVGTGPFISLHCGAIAESLLESELFGHEQGAFTGAIKQKMGRFELAKGGTLFLDEIGTMSSSAQIKLLQVLQEGMFQRVGGETDVQTDARLISATNEDLEDLCRQGRFRYDLFYRLNVIPIQIPPLRNRREDVPTLVNTFLEKLNQQYEKSIKGLDEGVLEALQAYEWPGNIRELENLMERAYILENTQLLQLKSFPLSFSGNGAAVLPLDTDMTLLQAREAIMEPFERQYLDNQLKKQRGRIRETAIASGISERQLHRLMRKYGLNKEHYKDQNSP